MNSMVSKRWYESKTILGVVVILLSQLAGVYGYSLDEQAQKDLTEILSVLGTSFGSAVALYGRLKAEKQIK